MSDRPPNYEYTARYDPDVSEAIALAHRIEEETRYNFNLRIVLMEATEDERAAIFSVFNRAKVARLQFRDRRRS